MNQEQAQRFLTECFGPIFLAAREAYKQDGRGFVALDMTDTPHVPGAYAELHYVCDAKRPSDLVELVARYDPETQVVIVVRHDDGEDLAVYKIDDGKQARSSPCRP